MTGNTIAITVSEEFAALMATAFADIYGYEAEIDGEPNPQTKYEFAVEKYTNFPAAVIKTYQDKIAQEAVPPAPLMELGSVVATGEDPLA